MFQVNEEVQPLPPRPARPSPYSVPHRIQGHQDRQVERVQRAGVGNDYRVRIVNDNAIDLFLQNLRP